MYVYNLYRISSGKRSLEVLEDGLDDFVGGGATAQVRGENLALGEDGIDGVVHLQGLGGVAEVLEEETGGADGSDRVRDALASDIGGRTVDGLTHDKVVADIGRGDDTERADQSSRTIADDITIEVGRDDHVKRLRLAEHAVDHRINELLLHVDVLVLVRVLLLDCAHGLAPETVSDAHDVGLVDDGDTRVLLPETLLEGLLLAQLLAGQRHVECHHTRALGGVLGDLAVGKGHLQARSGVYFLALGFDVLHCRNRVCVR